MIKTYESFLSLFNNNKPFDAYSEKVEKFFDIKVDDIVYALHDISDDINFEVFPWMSSIAPLQNDKFIFNLHTNVDTFKLDVENNKFSIYEHDRAGIFLKERKIDTLDKFIRYSYGKLFYFEIEFYTINVLDESEMNILEGVCDRIKDLGFKGSKIESDRYDEMGTTFEYRLQFEY